MTKKTKAKIPKGMYVHSEEKCSGKCPFHNPSNHHMVNWEISIRLDKHGLVERHCPKHGVGHPDPDSVSHFDSIGFEQMGIHGCCGCCNPNYKE